MVAVPRPSPCGGWTPGDALAVLTVVVGIGLVALGTYAHFGAVVARVIGDCDGCAPWHPLFVIAPLVVGTAAAVAASYYLAGRWA